MCREPSGLRADLRRAAAWMVVASAGSGLVVPSESWANPTTQTLPLVPDTFSPPQTLPLVLALVGGFEW